ncbi:BON domain-containing protein [Sphingomonas cannabina]|uniref:BON domain-containing protein n=1 Tax=Sphingomonas cannabina TaxID=2899123 RepID=UPI001F2F2ABD|nr:BON domain-containing protein [Sphingomonas cannabina]UIJ46331.1 BON domain-containing protein [Sphingomonas cannabina]
MRSDSQLQQDVIDQLSWAPDVEHGHIGVTARDGVVTLIGHVPSYAMKLAAERLTRGVKGVKAVAQEIDVRLPSEPKTSDDEIAGRIVRLFEWDARIPEDKISVKVERGYVTLTGEVEWNYQKQAAYTAAGRISGVRGVASYITVQPKPAPADLHERILAALKRSSEVDASTITVRVDGGKVTLGGAVRGWNERRTAEAAAWAAPGVLAVEDEIILA